MTTPLDLASRLAGSGTTRDQALGVAIVIRGLTDDSDDRAGWPMDEHTARAAAAYLGFAGVSDALIARALALAPTISDAMLNKGAAR